MPGHELIQDLDGRAQAAVRRSAPLWERDEILRQLCGEALNCVDLDDDELRSILSYVAQPEPTPKLILLDFMSELLVKYPERLSSCMDVIPNLLLDENPIIQREVLLLICLVWTGVLPEIFHRPELQATVSILEYVQSEVLSMVDTHLHDGLYRPILACLDAQVLSYKFILVVSKEQNLGDGNNGRFSSRGVLQKDVASIISKLILVLKESKAPKKMKTSHILYTLTTLSRIEIHSNGIYGRTVPSADFFKDSLRSEDEIRRIEDTISMCDSVDRKIRSQFPESYNTFTEELRGTKRSTPTNVLDNPAPTKKPRLDDVLTPELLGILSSLPQEEATAYLVNAFDREMIEELLDHSKGVHGQKMAALDGDLAIATLNGIGSGSLGINLDDPRLRASARDIRSSSILQPVQAISQFEKQKSASTSPHSVVLEHQASKRQAETTPFIRPKVSLEKYEAKAILWGILRRSVERLDEWKFNAGEDLLCKMAVAISGDSELKGKYLETVLSEWPTTSNVLLKWVYHEYVRESVRGDFSGYNDLVLKLFSHFREADGDSKEISQEVAVFLRLTCNFPHIDDALLGYLKTTCQEGKAFGFQSLLQLTLHRPSCTAKGIDAVVSLCFHTNSDVRRTGLGLISNKILKSSAAETLVGKATNLLTRLAAHKSADELYVICELEPGGESKEKTKKAIALCLLIPLNVLESRPEFMLEIMRAYVSCANEVKRAIHGDLTRIFKAKPKLLPDSALILLIQEFPQDSILLLLQILQLKTTADQLLSKEVADAVRSAFDKTKDYRFVVPIIPNLSKEDAKVLLVDFVLGPRSGDDGTRTKLGKKVTEAALTSFITHPESPMDAKEVIIELHKIVPAKKELSSIVTALDFIFSFKDVITGRVLASVLYELVNITPLPVLLMRTVLSTLKNHEKMVDQIIKFVMLPLVSKQIWRNKILWDGFVRVCGETYPRCEGMLRALPSRQKDEILRLIDKSSRSGSK